MALPAYASDAATGSLSISWRTIFLCIHSAIEHRIVQATLEEVKTRNVGGRLATDAKEAEKPSGGIRKSSIATRRRRSAPGRVEAIRIFRGNVNLGDVVIGRHFPFRFQIVPIRVTSTLRY